MEGPWAGFANGASVTTEYTYNAVGNVTADQNKGISAITYNMLNKPAQITFSDGRTVVYTYDASGSKLKMVTTAGGTTTTTEYVNGFVYENNALSFFSSPEGRVVKNGSNYEYQYSIADHQGNTRIVFSSVTPAATVATATYESTSESTQFDSYPTLGINSVSTNNHTSGGTKSFLMNGGYTSQVGVAKSFAVFPGDNVQIEAYARYDAATTNASGLSNFATSLLSAFNLSAPAQGETGTASSAINSWGTTEAGGNGDGSNDNTHPKAFINIILFDKNYNFLDISYAQVTSSGTPGYITASYAVKEAGYAYLYISNEQPVQTDVYFDDVKMTYTPTNVIQYNEYYPFGLQTSTSWTRTSSKNNFLYNEGSELNNTSGWYETFFRGYDAALGRFHQTDPMASSFVSHSPYHYAYNNPISVNDPMGAAPVKAITETSVPMDGGQGIGSSGDTGTGMMSIDQWKDFLNGVRDPNQNASIMSVAQFNSYYGIKTDEDRAAFVQRIGVDVTNASSKAAIANYLNPHNGASFTEGSVENGKRRLARNKKYGDYAEIDDNNAYVPYTNTSYWDYRRGKALGAIQTILDYAGTIPIVGEVFDGVNAGIYALNGDYVNAGLSSAAMIPIVGWGATGVKMGNKAFKAARGGGRVFWSGGKTQMLRAMVFAKNNGMTTLEMTLTGKTLTGLTNIFGYKNTQFLWDAASANFARGVNDSAHVFMNVSRVSGTSTFFRIEQPLLKNVDLFFHIN